MNGLRARPLHHEARLRIVRHPLTRAWHVEHKAPSGVWTPSRLENATLPPFPDFHRAFTEALFVALDVHNVGALAPLVRLEERLGRAYPQYGTRRLDAHVYTSGDGLGIGNGLQVITFFPEGPPDTRGSLAFTPDCLAEEIHA